MVADNDLWCGDEGVRLAKELDFMNSQPTVDLIITSILAFQGVSGVTVCTSYPLSRPSLFSDREK